MNLRVRDRRTEMCVPPALAAAGWLLRWAVGPSLKRFAAEEVWSHTKTSAKHEVQSLEDYFCVSVCLSLLCSFFLRFLPLLACFRSMLCVFGSE